MSGLLHACIFLEINCTFLMLFVVFLSYMSVLFFLIKGTETSEKE